MKCIPSESALFVGTKEKEKLSSGTKIQFIWEIRSILYSLGMYNESSEVYLIKPDGGKT